MTKVLRYSAALLFVTALSLLVGGSAAAQSTNNPRYRQFRDTAAASITTPAAGNVRLFFDSTGFYWKNSAGVATAVGGGGYSMLVASGANNGTLTLFDSTATVGISSLVIQAGQGQSTNVLQSWSNYAGTPLASVSAGGLFLAPNGAVGAPSFSFLGDTNSGLYSTAADTPGIAAGGVLIQSWTTTSADLVSSMGLRWGTDTAIWRNAAGVFEFTKGGSTADRATIYAGDAEFYDDTLTTGSTTLSIRSGAADATGSAPQLVVYANNGTTEIFKFNTNGYQLDVGTGPSHVRLSGNTADLVLGSASPTIFADSYAELEIINPKLSWPTNSPNVGLAYVSSGLIRVTNGSTGIGTIAVAKPVAAKTATHAVLATESGYVFTSEGTAGVFDFDLPAAAAGLTYTFYCHSTHDITIDALATDTIRGATVSGDGGTAVINDEGGFVTIVAINATEWIILASRGTITIT